MVNLLKDKHKSEFKSISKAKNSFQAQESKAKKDQSYKNKEREQAQAKTSGVNPHNLSRYRDLEGLTVGKMEFGFWFIKNKNFFVKSFYFLLILTSVVTWSLFFYTFGHYVIVGMKQDRELARDLTSTLPVSHNLIVSLMPRPILYGMPEVILQKDLDSQIVLEIENPNEKHWALVEYSYLVSNKTIKTSGSFVLPKETKYFIDVSESELIGRNNVNVKIDRISWHRHNLGEFSDYQEYFDEHVNFTISDNEFVSARKSALTEKLPINTLYFKIKNDTPFNYWSLPINILLNDGPQVQGFSEYTIDNFLSGEEKEISLSIPGVYNRVSNVEILPNLNILKNDIYIDFKAEIEEE